MGDSEIIGLFGGQMVVLTLPLLSRSYCVEPRIDKRLGPHGGHGAEANGNMWLGHRADEPGWNTKRTGWAHWSYAATCWPNSPKRFSLMGRRGSKEPPAERR